MIYRIKKRVQSSQGFSLAEVLIAVLLVLMMTSIVAAGIPAASNAYKKVVDSANAQTLLSTTMTSIRSELSTAKIIQVTNPVITYIGSDGAEASIMSSKGIYIKHSYDEDYSLLVSKAAANNNLYAAYDTIAYDSVKSCVVITGLKVFKDGTDSGPLVTIDKYDIRVIR